MYPGWQMRKKSEKAAQRVLYPPVVTTRVMADLSAIGCGRGMLELEDRRVAVQVKLVKGGG